MQNLRQLTDDWYKVHKPCVNYKLFQVIKESLEYQQELKDYCNFRTDNIHQMLYNFMHHLPDIPKCPQCNSNLQFKAFSRGYKMYCNESCQIKYEHASGKRKDSYTNTTSYFKKKCENLSNQYTLKEFLTEWFNTREPQANSTLLKYIKNNESFLQELKSYANFESNNINHLIWHYWHKERNRPKCKNCGKDLINCSIWGGYAIFCSKSCKTEYAHRNNEIDYSKAPKTFKELYGIGTEGHQGFLERRELTSKEHFGTTHHMKNPEFLKKYQDIIEELYAVRNVMHNVEVKNTLAKTNLERYGAISPLGNEEIQKRAHENAMVTLYERYGVTNPMEIPHVFAKSQRNSFRMYDYENTNLTYQAKYEKHFLDYCKNLNVLDKISNGPFLWYEYDGQRKRYFSDFIIEELNLIIEVKSTHWYEEYKAQNEAKKSECIARGFNFIFIIDKDYSEFNTFLKQLN